MQDAPAVQRIGGQEIDEEERRGDVSRRIGICVRLRPQPPQRGEKKRRAGIGERSRSQHGKFLLFSDARKVARDDGAVGHEHELIEDKPIPPRNERVRALVLDGGDGGGEKEQEIAREYREQPRREKERVDAELNSRQDRPRSACNS